MHRPLRFFDILCLGVNAIVGSGIFLIPGRLIGGVGPASIPLFLVCGLLLIPIGLCFAEASSHFDRNGGPYNYVSTAFGAKLGYIVGWIAVITAIFSYATVASGFPSYLATFLPGIDKPPISYTITGILIAFLAAINIRGVKIGARTTDFLTVAKLIPLAIFAIVGIYLVKPAQISFAPTHGFGPMAGLILAVVFTYQGFEVAPVPAGETANAKVVVPRAVIGSLILSALLYVVVQYVVVGCGADVSGSERPLADAAAAIMGPFGATLMAAGAIVSMGGFCAGIALSGPRYLTVLCEDGLLPAIGATEHTRFETPYVAIIFFAIAVFALTLFLNFGQLVDISAFAVVSQYVFTCLAVPLLRKHAAISQSTYRIPWGWTLPIIGVLVSIVFLVQIKLPEFIWGAATIAAGVIVAAIYRFIVRHRTI